MTAVATMAGHSGTTSWNTSTTAQARAMKIAAKMYFSIARSMTDPVDPRRDSAIWRDSETRSPTKTAIATANTPSAIQRKVFVARRAQQRLVGRRTGRREDVGRLDVPLDLRLSESHEAHQLEVAAPHRVLALEAEQQALVVDAQHVGAPRIAADSARRVKNPSPASVVVEEHSCNGRPIQ